MATRQRVGVSQLGDIPEMSLLVDILPSGWLTSRRIRDRLALSIKPHTEGRCSMSFNRDQVIHRGTFVGKIHREQGIAIFTEIVTDDAKLATASRASVERILGLLDYGPLYAQTLSKYALNNGDVIQAYTWVSRKKTNDLDATLLGEDNTDA